MDMGQRTRVDGYMATVLPIADGRDFPRLYDADMDLIQRSRKLPNGIERVELKTTKSKASA